MTSGGGGQAASAAPASLFAAAAACFAERDPARKVQATRQTAARFLGGDLSLDDPANAFAADQPGRPDRPALVAPRDLPRRSLHDAAGRAALIHAVAHIEFNAINLAWDAVLRFPGMPPDYYADWTRVADEEAYHFGLMRERLQMLGHDYGDFPAHDGLWGMALQTANDCLERMALVPRVMEARGLDVTPGMIERLRAVSDGESAERLTIILRDEVGHVAIGSRWFRYLCEERGLVPEQTYVALIERHLRGRIRCPLNRAARLDAGFGAAELDRLEALCKESARAGRAG